jgi:hypothetical protein
MTTLDRAVGSPAELPSSLGPLDALRAWGWDDDRVIEFPPFAEAGLWPARVVAQHRGLWLLVGRAFVPNSHYGFSTRSFWRKANFRGTAFSLSVATLVGLNQRR